MGGGGSSFRPAHAALANTLKQVHFGLICPFF
uniref:Uncharacterized protein n=1 Tax=Anguilla anguilla TaxID=7936 RepID=A0A0E9QNV3_ANGAN